MAGGPNVGGGKRGSAAQTVGVLNLLTDLAFNLLIFFVVCASTEPEKGRPQQMPSSSKEKASDQKPLNVEVKIERTSVSVNGEVTDTLGNDRKIPATLNLYGKLKELLAGKTRVEDRIVIVTVDKQHKDTPYSWWIKITGEVERAGGVITLQLEEEREVGVR